jgi:hypothetical protein
MPSTAATIPSAGSALAIKVKGVREKQCSVYTIVKQSLIAYMNGALPQVAMPLRGWSGSGRVATGSRRLAVLGARHGGGLDLVDG